MKVSFFCGDCDLDQDLEPRKMALSTGEEFFRAKCFGCGRDLNRYLTDAKIDPYFRLSKKLRLQRTMLARDLIQPGEDGFQMLYKAEYDKIEAAREEAFNKEQAQKAADIALYEKHKHNINEREAVKRVFALEEKLNG